MTNFIKYAEYTNSLNLIVDFRKDFYSLIDSSLTESEATYIKSLYASYDFDLLRKYIDNKVEKLESSILDLAHQYKTDAVVNFAYSKWKSVSNAFSLFDEVYNDLMDISNIEL
jgi:hypothetical protein